MRLLVKNIEVNLNHGDMLVYKGCDLAHWRNEFNGYDCAQVFLHYNEKGGQYDIPYDGRPILGMPGTFREKNTVEKQDKIMTENKVINTSKKIIY